MRSFSMTDIGKKRTVNQDYVYKSDSGVGVLENLYIVADGMGGHRAGDFASKYTVEIICSELENSESDSPESILVHALEVANSKVLMAAETDEHLKGMGTTAVVATVLEDMLYFVNVGDSRLYLINDGIQQLSKDHSLVEEMVRLGGIRPEEAKNHPDKNVITRAIGGKDTIEIDFFQHQLKPHDMILMCTDGLSNMLSDNEIFQIVQGSRDIIEAVQSLVHAANKNGGNDNIGIVLFEPMIGEVSIC